MIQILERGELDYVRQALYEGIKGREESRELLGNTKADDICREVDNEIIEMYRKIIKRIGRKLKKLGGEE